jgi:hypothetical protein
VRRNNPWAYLLIAFLIIFPVACGGSNSGNENQTYETKDLQGTWDFIYSPSSVTGEFFLTFDNNGNLIGVSLPADSDDEILEFSGALVVTQQGAVYDSLQITVLVKEPGSPDQTVPMTLKISGNFTTPKLIVGTVLVSDPETQPMSSFTMTFVS